MVRTAGWVKGRVWLWNYTFFLPFPCYFLDVMHVLNILAPIPIYKMVSSRSMGIFYQVLSLWFSWIMKQEKKSAITRQTTQRSLLAWFIRWRRDKRLWTITNIDWTLSLFQKSKVKTRASSCSPRHRDHGYFSLLHNSLKPRRKGVVKAILPYRNNFKYISE